MRSRARRRCTRSASSSGVIPTTVATRPDADDDEITLLTNRLTPGLAGCAVLLVVGLFAPVVAVMGYLAIAVFFLLPLHIHQRDHLPPPA